MATPAEEHIRRGIYNAIKKYDIFKIREVFSEETASACVSKDVMKRKAVTETSSDCEQQRKISKTTGKEKGGTEKLSIDLKEMLLSGDHSDTTIRVKGEDFKLHRNILSARNPYFCAMFKTEMREKATGIVSVDDCEPHVFRSFIHFVYSGKVDKLSANNVCDLYKLADKYQENELKKICLSFMLNNMSVDNFCDFTASALKHEESSLLQAATNFFCMKVTQIIRCAKWLAFLRKYPTEANELFIRAADYFHYA